MLQSSVPVLPMLPVRHLVPNWQQFLTQQRMMLLTVSMTELPNKSGLGSTTLQWKETLSGKMAHLPTTPNGRRIVTKQTTITQRTALEKQ